MFGQLSLLNIPSALSLHGFRVCGYSLPQFSDPNDSDPMSSGSPSDNLLELGHRRVNSQRAVGTPLQPDPTARWEHRPSPPLDSPRPPKPPASNSWREISLRLP